jgi:hypothetical protein
MSFVYALAVAHILATVGDIIGAWSRVRFSWLNASWMLFAFLAVFVWWVNLWDLRSQTVWTMGLVAIFFAMASILYLEVRLVCARIPGEGAVDLVAFHKEAGRKYMAGFAVLAGFTELLNVFYWQRSDYAFVTRDPIDWAVFIQCIASIVAASISNRRVQAAMTIVVGLVWVWFLFFLQSAFR